MDPKSQVLLRQAEYFNRTLLLAGAPADELLSELAQAQAWCWLADDYAVLQSRYADRVSFSHQPPAVETEDALLFLPKSRELTEFLLQTLSSLPSVQRLFLVGEKKAGIERAAKQLARLGKTWKLDSARHCQLWVCELASKMTCAPEQWQQNFPVSLADGSSLQLCSLPGVFSHGRLDMGTALLLEHLDGLPSGHLLDFGCGAGVIGAALKLRYPHSTVSMLDVDAFAVESSKRTLELNELQADVVAGRGIADAPHQLAAIVTNPPFHKGVQTHYQATEELISQSAKHLLPGGELRLVANSFLRYPELIEQHLGKCRVLVERNGFRVYSAKRAG